MKSATIIEIGFDDTKFSSDLAHRIVTPGVRPIDVVEQLLTEALSSNIQKAVQLLKPPSVKIHSTYNLDRAATLARLADAGFSTWYASLSFSTCVDGELDDVVLTTRGLELIPLSYGTFLLTHRHRAKLLKTQINHMLKLNQIRISPVVFARVTQKVDRSLLTQPWIANPRPGPRSNGFEHGIEGYDFVSFDHLITGARQFCSCSAISHDKLLKKVSTKVSQYDVGSWPHQVASLLATPTYADKVCHLCISRSQGAEAAAERYGHQIQEFVSPYIDQLMLTHGYDKRTARAEVQQTLGISRWVREAEMYELVKRLFPNHQVIREASPDWLGRQRLDVYLPALGLALEHQGAQHYGAIAAFGGEVAFKRNQERDALKRRLCNENGVELIEIGFNQAMTTDTLRRRLRRFLIP